MSFPSRIFQSIILRGNTNGRSPSLDGMLAQFDKELANFQTLFRPAPESRPRTPFDGNLPPDKVSMANLTLAQILSLVPIMAPLRLAMQRSAEMYEETSHATRSEADPGLLAELESIARSAGATAVKYVKVPPNAIFQHMGIPHEYAIVISAEMDEEIIGTAPSFEAFREVAKGYLNLAIISNRMARFLHRNGFAAYPGTALGGLTDYCYLAELAGLGAIGYHGLLITPNEGARSRINAIYTNIANLPIENENEQLWIRDFCSMCRKCIRECPVTAVFGQPRPRGDGGMQCIDHDACRDYFHQNFGCGICLAVCPFSYAGYEKIRARFKGNPTAPQFRIPATAI